MILSIDTHLEITPDILHDISTQLEQGLSRGLTPYHWHISKPPSRDLESVESSIEEAQEHITLALQQFNELKSTLDDLFTH